MAADITEREKTRYYVFQGERRLHYLWSSLIKIKKVKTKANLMQSTKSRLWAISKGTFLFLQHIYFTGEERDGEYDNRLEEN